MRITRKTGKKLSKNASFRIEIMISNYEKPYIHDVAIAYLS